MSLSRRDRIYGFENLVRKGLADYWVVVDCPKILAGTPGTGRLTRNPFSPISRSRNPMAPQTNPKMAQQRPRAATDSARFRSQACRICQGCDQGQICRPTIVVKIICIAKSHPGCLFDSLPAEHLHFSSVPTKSVGGALPGRFVNLNLRRLKRVPRS